jgi:hypothetical protein
MIARWYRPYQSSGLTGTPVRHIDRAILKIAWWLWAACFAVGCYGPA